MRISLETSTLFCSLLLSCPGNAQTDTKILYNTNTLQYGFSVKTQIDLHFRAPEESFPNFRVCINAGISRDLFTKYFHPALNFELQLYNGGIGSNFNDRQFDRLKVDFISALTLTTGLKNLLRTNGENLNRIMPLYYFGDFVNPALKNPFNYSFSVGTDYIVAKGRKAQRVGFLNFNFKGAQVTYYNDGGTPIYESCLGDRRDRYYTGGVIFSYQGYDDDAINLVQLSYHKFTGFSEDAFELANKLHLFMVNYVNNEEERFNKSVWSLTLGNPNRGWSGSVRAFNSPKYDLQHFIHFSDWFAYHLVPYRPHLAISGSHNYTKNKIGL